MVPPQLKDFLVATTGASSAFIGLLFVAFADPRAAAQPPRRQPTPNDTLVSPDVHKDQRVTFRLYAPKASEVTLGDATYHRELVAQALDL